MDPMIDIRQADSPADYDTARSLFLEYADQIGFDLCFQNFEQELRTLERLYSPPGGALLIAWMDGRPVGCGAMKRFDPDICEMKRLYVKREVRGVKAGRRIAERLIELAVTAGYTKMRLDTVKGLMDPAINLYESLGFVEIPPYRHNPQSGAFYMELDLTCVQKQQTDQSGGTQC